MTTLAAKHRCSVMVQFYTRESHIRSRKPICIAMWLLLSPEWWHSLRLVASRSQCPRRRPVSAQQSTDEITQIPSRRSTSVPLVQQQFCRNRPGFSHHLRDGVEPPAQKSAGRRVIGRPPRGAARTVRCTTCSSRRRSRARLHVHTHPLRTRCRMRASVHTGTARRHTPGGEALPAGCHSRDTFSFRSLFDWAAKCNPPNRAFPDRTPCRSPCRAESHRAPTAKDSRARNSLRLGKAHTHRVPEESPGPTCVSRASRRQKGGSRFLRNRLSTALCRADRI